MKLTDFIFDSAYQFVTWICIALSVGSFFYFLNKGIGRGVFWSAVGLLVFTTVMIGLVADRYFFRNSSNAAQNERP